MAVPSTKPAKTRERILWKPEESVVVVKILIPRKSVTIFFLIKLLKVGLPELKRER
jgi:hypothetical protein